MEHFPVSQLILFIISEFGRITNGTCQLTPVLLSSGHMGTHGQQLVVIGGGAAGFFTAISAADENPDAQISIYESGTSCLRKVKVSGGGRCNVTHSCFDPAQLATSYPRGSRELRSAFHRWQPEDTINWFEERNVLLKTEPDGRMFPTTDDSQTIIDCFEAEARAAGISVHKGIGIEAISPLTEGGFQLAMTDGRSIKADKLCLSCGSLKDSPLASQIEAFGHTIEPLAPSLFAFNSTDSRLQGLSGISVDNVSVSALPESSVQQGPILITHRGFSGPAILRLSAWEARRFQKESYQFMLSINWLGDVSTSQARDIVAEYRRSYGKSLIRNRVIGGIPRHLWERLIKTAEVDPDTRWAHLPKNSEEVLVCELTDARFQIEGKTTNKEEFVTCGGIRLKEVDFRRMESKIVPGLHFAGECLDLDGITGGFNFQAAWTTGKIAGQSMGQ